MRDAALRGLIIECRKTFEQMSEDTLLEVIQISVSVLKDKQKKCLTSNPDCEINTQRRIRHIMSTTMRNKTSRAGYIRVRS